MRLFEPFVPKLKGLLFYLVSLILFVLISELIYNLMGLLFFNENLWLNIQSAALTLGIIFFINLQIRKQLEVNLPWFENPMRRFLQQSLLMSLGTPLLVQTALLCTAYFCFVVLKMDLLIQYRLLILNYFIYAFVIQLNVAVDLGNYFFTQWQASRLQQITFEKEKAQFNLELLRNQINPHFLFNNLNTLSALIYEDADKASGFVRMLSKVYRNILEYKNKETVSLEEELSFFDTYMQLLGIRFKDMILLEMQVEPTMLPKKMIPLTLQLLIENAIKHNVLSRSEPLKISISTHKQQLIVSNPIHKKESLDYSSGLGLKIIGNRYAYLSERQLEVENNGQSFTIKIPLL